MVEGSVITFVMASDVQELNTALLFLLVGRRIYFTGICRSIIVKKHWFCVFSV
jgi:hypothetical protein